MLLRLKIKNIAVIEEADIEFFEGLNVLTGETGAGKSILIDSISMLTGVRSNRELIRTGEEKASVYGLFEPGDRVWKILGEEGIGPSEDGLLSVSRELNVSGKSVCRIGGNTVPLSVLKKIGSYLINIHGQQDALELYAPEKHIVLLDKWCGDVLTRELSGYRESYKKYISLAKENREITALREKREAEMDFLEFEVNEITQADIRIGEEAELLKKREELKNAEKLSKAVEMANDSLFESGGSANERLDITAMKFEQLSGVYSELEKTVEKLREIVSLMSDVRVDLRRLESESYASEKLEEITDRLDVINKMKRKYGGNEEAVLSHLNKASEKLYTLKNAQELSLKMEEEMTVLKAEIAQKAEKLHSIRETYGKKLAGEIMEQLADLNMEGSVFVTDIKKVPYGGLGSDGVEFLISPNRGEDIKPLSKIASGGELSRIMLAIKCIMADTDEARTYIFDEIDTGVSGRAAQKVAAKLKKVGETKQTFVITHSAHIAAAGTSHFRIEKSVENGRTKTHITLLDRKGRILEIARINSGSNITDTALKQAEEMLDN